MPFQTPLENSELQARLRFLSLGMIAVALVGWGVNFRPFDDLVDRTGTPLGADYPVFYLAGRTVLDGRVDELYSHEAQQRRLHELFPTLAAGDWLPFRYPPFVAAAMTPLAALPYSASWIAFTFLSLAALVVAWRSLVVQLDWMRGSRCGLSLLVLLGWPVTLETLLGGQSSLFSLAILCGTTALVDRRRYTAAGAVLALAAFKPNVLALFAVGYVLRYPRMLRGAIPIGLALAAASVATVGFHGCEEYLLLGARLASQAWDFETDAHKVHGLAAWLIPFVAGYERPLLLTCGLAATLAIVLRWRRCGNDRRTNFAATALLVSLNLLANPYVPIYDLALLAAGWCFFYGAICESSESATPWSLQLCRFVGALVYLGPHLSQLGAAHGLPQWFTPCWVAVAAWQWRTFQAWSQLNPASLAVTSHRGSSLPVSG